MIHIDVLIVNVPEKCTINVTGEQRALKGPLHCIIEFFQERLRDRVYQHYSLMAAFAAKRHRPWVDDVWIQLLMAVFSQITSPSILFLHLKLVNRAKPRIFTTLWICHTGPNTLVHRHRGLR